MHSARIALAVALLSLGPGARSLAAQQLRGAVRDSASQQPVVGAVVSILDVSGRVLVRTLANEAGRFSLSVPAGAARLRVIRIGYQPRDIAVPAGAAGNTPLEMTMNRIPALLESMRVSGQSICPGSVDRNAAVALWEQSRAGLLATVVAREARPAIVRTLIFERRLSPDELVVVSTSRARSGVSARPFLSSLPPAQFALAGYMQDSGAVRIFHAPDADVLLDESFAATHCFRVVRDDASHAGEIGLAFNAAPGRDSLVEVEGTLWLDSALPALRSLEFRFTNIEPAAVAAKVGGALVFRGMANGVVLIERWRLRLATLTETPSLNRLPGQLGPNDWRGRRTRQDLRVVEFRETGGEVLSAAWPEAGLHWEGTLGTVAGRIVMGPAHVPLANAEVWLDGTADTVTTNQAGEYHLELVIPGHYTLRVADTAFASFFATRTGARGVVVGRSLNVQPDIELPPIDDAATLLCGRTVTDRTSILLGRVVTDARATAPGVRLRAFWQADYDRVSQSERGGSVSVTSRQLDVEADQLGRFHLCGVVRERPIGFHLTRGTAVLADTAVMLFGDTLVRTVTLVVPLARQP